MRQDRDQFVADLSDLFAKPAFELFSGRAERQISARANQIDHGLGLGEVHFAVEKRALSEFAGTRRPCACAQTSFKNFRGNERATVATDLHQIFARVTGGRAMDRKHRLIDRFIFRPENFAQMLNV